MDAILKKSAKRISGVFLRGLVVVLPIAITLALVYWLIVSAEALFGGAVRLVIPDEHYWAGLGVLIGIVLVFAAGIAVNAWFTRALLERTEALMERIPVVKSIYGAVRDLARFFSDGKRRGFHKVVLVTLGGDMRVIGFLTREDFASLPQFGSGETVAVYLPMSYQIGGYTVYLPRTALEPLDMSVEDAMRFTLTAGMSSAQAPESSARPATEEKPQPTT